MNKHTIITAFFDIGRKDFEIIPRSNDEYFKHFECWARLNNKLIVYTQPHFSESIKDIRKKYNQLENTIIITIDNICDIEHDIYQKYCEIAQEGDLDKFKLIKGTIAANKPTYIYLMLMKYWFMKDTVKRGYVEEYATWLDFGYGHGNFFMEPTEFDFEWKYDFGDKITLFTCHELDNVPMYEVVRCSLNYIMGFMVVVPKEQCEKHWQYMKEAAEELYKVGFIDDDQTVLLQAYRNHKEDYQIINSDWFMPLVTYGGNHLKVVEKTRPKSIELKKWLEPETEKYAKDCSERTYRKVYDLYYKDRSI